MRRIELHPAVGRSKFGATRRSAAKAKTRLLIWDWWRGMLIRSETGCKYLPFAFWALRMPLVSGPVITFYRLAKHGLATCLRWNRHSRTAAWETSFALRSSARSKLLTVEATLAQRSVGGDWITGRPLLGIRVDSAAGVAGRTTGGALVREVKPGSPADRGELPPGAVIVAMDDRPIVSAQDLTESVWQSRPGQTIELEYFIGQTRNRQFFRLAAADAMPATPRDGQRILPQRPVVDPAHREFSERDLYLLEPDRNSESDGDIDSLRATVHKLEQHVQVLQAQLEETTRLLFEIKQQIEERESPLED